MIKIRKTALRRRAAAREAIFGGCKLKIRAYRHPMRFALHIRKPDSHHGLPGFDGIDVFICNISAVVLAFTGHRPLPTVHCSLPIVHSSPKEIPRRRPRAYRICNTGYIDGGLRRGGLGGGGPRGTGLSERLHRVGRIGCRLRLSASRFFVRRANR